MSEVIDPETGEVTTHAIAVQPAREVAVQPAGDTQSGALMRMIEAAVMRPDFDVEKMRALMDMKRQFDADEARKAYNEAFAAFKAEAVQVLRTKTITDGPLKGKKHVELSGIVNAATAALSKHGLSVAWRLSKDERDWIEVTCTVSHVAGHSETVAMGGPPDTGPGRNAIQARVSTKTYLERTTMMAILGLAGQDEDDDGAGGAPDLTTAKNNTAAALLESYARALRDADTDAKAAGIWTAGLVALRETGNQAAQAEFRAMVVARRNELKGGAA